MTWATTAIVGGSIVSGAIGADAAGKAGDQQAEAAAAATAEQRRQYDQTRYDLGPYREAGYTSLDQLMEMQGMKPSSYAVDIENAQAEVTAYNDAIQQVIGDQGRTPEQKQLEVAQYQQKLKEAEAKLAAAKQRDAEYKPRSSQDLLASTPGYQFRLSEGEKALDRYQSSKRITGGRAVKEAMRYGQDYASNEFNSNFNRTASIAGMGQGAVNTGVQAGQTAANNIGQYTMAGGQAQANATMGEAGAYNNAIQGGLNNYMTLQTYNDLTSRLPSPQTYT